MDPAPDPLPASPRRIGVFGGSFDPPHRGHVAVASDVADALGLEQILWIPVGSPPHKPSVVLAPGDARLAMVRAATEADDRFAVSTLELDRPGPSFTLDTLVALRARWPYAECFLIIGVDQFRQFASWHRPADVLRHATLAVMDREGESARSETPDVPGLAGTVFVPVRRVDVSATDVRTRVREGSSIATLVPESVERIIRSRRLYRDCHGPDSADRA